MICTSEADHAHGFYYQGVEVPVFSKAVTSPRDFFITPDDADFHISMRARIGYRTATSLWDTVASRGTRLALGSSVSMEKVVPRHRIRQILVDALDGYSQLSVSLSAVCCLEMADDSSDWLHDSTTRSARVR